MHASTKQEKPDKPALSSQAPKWTCVHARAFDQIQKSSACCDTPLAWHFFIFFSRFECALKQHDQYLNKGNPAKPSANWSKFASINNKSFQAIDCPQLDAAVTYFHNTPPLKQVVESHGLGWGNLKGMPKNGQDFPWLVRCVCTVRNNLFHGGKYPYRYKDDESRNPILLEHSLTVLSHALRIDKGIEQLFLAEFN